LSAAIAGASGPRSIRVGPHSASSRVVEKTTFGIVFIGAAKGSVEVGQ
jgi:hypothetical protein